MDAWTANQACRITDVTYKQLDYWARTGLLIPNVAVAEGTGTMRLYDFHDLVALGVIKRFRDHGIRQYGTKENRRRTGVIRR